MFIIIIKVQTTSVEYSIYLVKKNIFNTNKK